MRSVRPSTARQQRVVAALVGLWFVLGTILGAGHEAHVAHVVDPHTGEIRHADVIVGNEHGQTQLAYHGTESRSDNDVCGIATALHQAARASSPVTAIVAAALPVAQILGFERDATIASADVYRFAPKTSPPARV